MTWPRQHQQTTPTLTRDRCDIIVPHALYHTSLSLVKRDFPAPHLARTMPNTISHRVLSSVLGEKRGNSMFFMVPEMLKSRGFRVHIAGRKGTRMNANAVGVSGLPAPTRAVGSPQFREVRKHSAEGLHRVDRPVPRAIMSAPFCGWHVGMSVCGPGYWISGGGVTRCDRTRLVFLWLGRSTVFGCDRGGLVCRRSRVRCVPRQDPTSSQFPGDRRGGESPIAP